ncbi:MAG: DUF2293 domain-containing protein [Crocinitomicaceae bacterium]|nr:DUF2293 domain-containing protein [Crocinitomicaceae bacterium]
MNTFVQNIYLTKKETLKCISCNKRIALGQAFVAETENHKGTCFACSPFSKLAFLKSGSAALTRRSKKHSSYCGVLFAWNRRRKRFERKGQYVEKAAIAAAQAECSADEEKRALKNERAAVAREVQDKIYIEEFSKAIRAFYPNCPKNRELAIAKHACEKHSGRVGRTAKAKEFDKSMIDLAVEAHIRHKETNYDSQFGRGKTKRAIRSDVKQDITYILRKWAE